MVTAQDAGTARKAYCGCTLALERLKRCRVPIKLGDELGKTDELSAPRCTRDDIGRCVAHLAFNLFDDAIQRLLFLDLVQEVLYVRNHLLLGIRVFVEDTSSAD